MVAAVMESRMSRTGTIVQILKAIDGSSDVATVAAAVPPTRTTVAPNSFREARLKNREPMKLGKVRSEKRTHRELDLPLIQPDPNRQESDTTRLTFDGVSGFLLIPIEKITDRRRKTRRTEEAEVNQDGFRRCLQIFAVKIFT